MCYSVVVINSSENRRRLNSTQRAKLDLSCDLDLSAAGKSLAFLNTYCTVRSPTASLISNTVKTTGSWPRPQWKERVETCRDGCRVSAPHPQGALWMILRLRANQRFLVLDIFMSTKDIESFIVHWSPWYELFKASQSWFHSEYEPKGPEPKPLLVGKKMTAQKKGAIELCKGSESSTMARQGSGTFVFIIKASKVFSAVVSLRAFITPICSILGTIISWEWLLWCSKIFYWQIGLIWHGS